VNFEFLKTTASAEKPNPGKFREIESRLQRVKPFFVGTYTYYSYRHHSSRNLMKLIKKSYHPTAAENDDAPLTLLKRCSSLKIVVLATEIWWFTGYRNEDV
jgi:hypothetical protein